MNLHRVVTGAISAVNPPVTGTLKVSTGYLTASNGKRIPQYGTFPGLALQVQPLSASDLKQLDALNIQGVERAVYMNGNIAGLDRQAGRGGDILTWGTPPTTWLVTAVIEPWDANGWTKVGVTQQTAPA